MRACRCVGGTTLRVRPHVATVSAMRSLLVVLLAACGTTELTPQHDAGSEDAGSDDAGEPDAGPLRVDMQYWYYDSLGSTCDEPDKLKKCDAGTFNDGGLSRWVDMYGDAGCIIVATHGAVLFDCLGLCHYDGGGRADSATCCSADGKFGRPK